MERRIKERSEARALFCLRPTGGEFHGGVESYNVKTGPVSKNPLGEFQNTPEEILNCSCRYCTRQLVTLIALGVHSDTVAQLMSRWEKALQIP